MASSSSTSRTWKYDVFPSFSGEDVRKTFLSHLLVKLRSKLIDTFIDDGIERSRPIAPELISAIRGSMISIIVFSKKYAASTWCLNELVEIHKCYKELDQMVIPVFYDVDPSDVRKQTGEFGNTFKETCKRTTEDVEQQLKWMEALKEVASIAGEDSRNWSNEANMIEQISKNVSNKLFTQSEEDFGDCVGIDAHIEAMNSMLCLEKEEVRMVGIVGPSGIGKSTIARAIFSRLSSRFDNRAFVSYKRTIQDDYGMKLAWEKQFLSDILGQKDINLDSLGVVERRLKNRKVLIVVDDVDDLKLLETIVGNKGWFGCGSRIIVVTQDKQILKSHEIELIHEVDFPSEDLALEMLCRSAFGQNSPPDGFMKLADEVAKLAGNLPLGLSVLGSSLRRRDKEEWVKMLPRLRDGLDGKIEKTLRISYDALDRKDQDLFIHIACFLSGKRVNYIEDLLKGSANIGLRILAEKSLIRISPYKTVEMHNLLRALGREIVRAESISNPGERRFLVDAKDIYDVFMDSTGTESMQGIICNTSEFSEPLTLDKESFKRMKNLQFLKFYQDRCWVQKTGEVGLYLPEGLDYLPRKLGLLHWDDYPAKYIPSNFIGDHLVELTMKNSKLVKVWEGGTQSLKSLVEMNLSESESLKEIPDLSKATNLEYLDLSGCENLIEIPDLSKATSLLHLDLKGCENLIEIPDLSKATNLGILDLSGCKSLKEIPDLSKATNLEYLNLSGCENVIEIPDLSKATSLLHLDLSGCENLIEIPNLSKATNLWDLGLSDCKSLKEIPDLSKATNLKYLILSGCENLIEIPDLPTCLKILCLDDCKSLVTFPSSFGNLDNLERLEMRKCTSLVVLPIDINLVSLTQLVLDGCSALTSFPQLSTSLKEISLDDTAIEEVPSWIENIAGLTLLSMRRCEKLRKISATILNLKRLESVGFTEVTSITDASLVKNLKEIPDLSKATNLLRLNLSSCKSLKEIPDLSKATSLLHLDLKGCENLIEIPDLPTSLTHLRLEDCKSLVRLPSSFENLDNLKILQMAKCTSLMVLPTDINLVSLTQLVLDGCSALTSFPQLSTSLKEISLDDTAIEEVPSWIENIAGLTLLSMRRCEKLRKISTTIWNLKRLCFVDFTGCSGVTSITDASLVKTELHPRMIEARDAKNDRSKKRMKMTIVTSQKPSTLPDMNLELRLDLGGASSNFLGVEYHSVFPSYPCLEEEAVYVDPMITEQDTETLIEDPFSTPQFINIFR